MLVGLRRRLAGVVTLALLVTAAPVSAQVDFTGEWELAGPPDPLGLSLSPLGERGTIVHGAETLTITPSGRLHAPEGARTYRLDGSDNQTARTNARGDAVTYTSRVRWVSGALLVTTTHLTAGRERGWDDAMMLSLNGEGHLEIVVVTPNLWPISSTTTVRLVYRKVA